MSNVEYRPAETFQVKLSRPDSGTPWGFRLQGGMDFSTPLSVQIVQPNSVAERCGLAGGDAILKINAANTDELTHEKAKNEIVRSGNEIIMLIARGAVHVWKPQVTPLSELRPAELKPIKIASGEEVIPVQKTSLVYNKPVQEPCRIGSSHNRAARPFGAPATKKTANVMHSQYNTPIGLYSADNIAHSYATQTAAIQKEMENLDLEGEEVGEKTSAATYQPVPQESQGQISDDSESARYKELEPGEEPSYKGYTNPHVQSRSFKTLQDNLEQQGELSIGGFRSVKAPTAIPAGEGKPQQSSMRCGGCDMLAQGVIVKAKGVPYHVECFKCASCGMNLKQKGYFTIEDKLYCETHAKRIAQSQMGSDMVATAVYR